MVEMEQGLPTRVKWCERRTGPCPFPGTPEHRWDVVGGDRKCADSPGQRLSVHYSDDIVVEARRRLRDAVDRDAVDDVDKGNVYDHALHVAIAALTACIGTEDDPVRPAVTTSLDCAPQA